jgi:hypothetical protein
LDAKTFSIRGNGNKDQTLTARNLLVNLNPNMNQHAPAPQVGMIRDNSNGKIVVGSATERTNMINHVQTQLNIARALANNGPLADGQNQATVSFNVQPGNTTRTHNALAADLEPDMARDRVRMWEQALQQIGSSPAGSNIEVVSSLNNPNGHNNEFHNGLDNGRYSMIVADLHDGASSGRMDAKHWTEMAQINQDRDTEHMEKAKAEFDREDRKIQAKDKRLELDQKQIETQNKAATNQLESVQKLVQGNVEKGFKLFS